MRVREAGSRDLERIAALFGQLGYPNDPARLAARFAAADSAAPAANMQVLVADDGGSVAGVAVVHVVTPLHVPDRWALLSALVVDDARRSAGTGAALMRAAEEWAVAHGCAQLELSSNVARTRAHQFYERQGYREKRVRFVKALVR